MFVMHIAKQILKAFLVERVVLMQNLKENIWTLTKPTVKNISDPLEILNQNTAEL